MKEPRKYGQEQADIICPICGKTAGYLASDMRPVFPEERLLVELLLNKKPHTYINSSVWASNNRSVFVSKEYNPMDVLGIGSNMVKSLRYWLPAVGLSESPKGKSAQYLTEFGEIVYKNTYSIIVLIKITLIIAFYMLTAELK